MHREKENYTHALMCHMTKNGALWWKDAAAYMCFI